VGKLRKRLADLEKLAPSWVAPTEEEERKRVFEQGLTRLSVVELGVLQEILELKRAHPDMKPTEFLHLLTPVQHNMESLWRWILWRESQSPTCEAENEEGDEEMERRKAELLRRSGNHI
jgi:hypothetical protein